MSGWIKLHRSIVDHWLKDRSDWFAAWVIVLCTVNHAPATVVIESDTYHVGVGESIRSWESWAKLFGKGWTAKKVRTFFAALEKNGMIARKRAGRRAMLVVCEYNTYQSAGHVDGQGAGKERAESGQGEGNKQERSKNEERTNEEGEPADGTAKRIFYELSELLMKTLDKQKREKDISWMQGLVDRYHYNHVYGAVNLAFKEKGSRVYVSEVATVAKENWDV